jgi:cytochrome c oxidase subunit III
MDMPRSIEGSESTSVLDPQPHIGGRGPDEHPPNWGDGGGDDWHNQPHGRRGPRDRLHKYRIGLGLALVSIYILFTAFVSAYMVRQGGGRLDTSRGIFVSDWKPLVVPGILWVNTALLLLSSLSVEFARRQLFSEPLVIEEWLGLGTPTRRRSLPWLGITLILGIGFLAGQYLAWNQLIQQGVFIATNPSSDFFFLLTGTHAVHLFGGLLALLWAGISSLVMRPLESRQIATDISAWYWHSMGILWLAIFVLFIFVK